MKKNIIKFILLVFVFTLIIGAQASAANGSGSCGSNARWTLSGSTLTISGTGAMTDYASASSAPWYSNIMSIETINIGSGITHIGNYAFNGCLSAGSVSVASSVTSIGDQAFAGCSSLGSINLSNVTSIGDSAFNSCKYLSSATLSSSLVKLGNYAFFDCEALTSISVNGNSLKIGDWAFSSCYKLSSITLGSGVVEIGTQSFSQNDSLQSITLPSKLTTIGEKAFYHDDGLTSITIPDSVTSMGARVFMSCTALKSVKIGNGLTTTGVGTFNACKALTSITYGSKITTIGQVCFGACTGLTVITIPDTVTTIDGGAFNTCGSVKTINMGGSVTSIGSSAFQGITAVVNYPASVSSIAGQGYGGSLTWVLVGGSSSDSVSIASNPSAASVKEGASASFRVSATGSGTISYQWQQCDADGNWSNYTGSGCNSATMTVTPSFSMNGYKYRCKVTCGSATATSNAATLTVSAVVTITSNPSAVTVNEGEKASFTVVATSSSSTLSYQWQESTNGSSWSNIYYDGFYTATLSVEATTDKDGYYYRCKISDSAGNATYSSSAKLTVKGGLTITSQPVSASVEEGEKATFTVVASGDNLTYQWQAWTPSKKTWSNSGLAGNKTATLTVQGTSARNGYKFRCVVKDGTNTVTSSAATLTVVTSPIKINSQSVNQAYPLGATVKYKVDASSTTGSALTYNWQVKTSSTASWKDSSLAGHAGAVLTLNATPARKGYQFRCIISDADGNSISTDPVTLSTTSAASSPISFTYLIGNQIAAIGTTVKFNAPAKSTAGTVTYQWQVKTSSSASWKDSSLAGNKTSTLKVAASASRNGYQFRCLITDSVGNQRYSPVVTLTTS